MMVLHSIGQLGITTISIIMVYIKKKTFNQIIILLIAIVSFNYGKAQNTQQMFWALNQSQQKNVLTWDNTTNNNRIDNGSGNWRNNNTISWTADGGATNIRWTNTSNAVFGGNPGFGNAGTITVGNQGGGINANSIKINPTPGGTFIFNGSPVTISGLSTITTNADAIFNTADIQGTSGLIKAGAGTLYLNSAKTYSGNTYINNGSLGGSGSILNSANVYINNGGFIFGGTGSGNNGTFTTNNIVFNSNGGGINVYSNNTTPSLVSSGALTLNGGLVNIYNTLPSGTYTIIQSTGITLNTLPSIGINNTGFNAYVSTAGNALQISIVDPANSCGGNITGFGGNGTGWTLNGGATVTTNILTLTTAAGNQARTAFFNNKINFCGDFTASFVYQAQGADTSLFADGVTFMIQNDPRGINAVGGFGGGLGYGNQNGGTPITNSIAIEFNNYRGSGNVGFQFNRNGVVTLNNYTSTNPINFRNQNPVLVQINYHKTLNNIVLTLTDQVTKSVYSTTINNINFTTSLGGTAGYVGFSGGTGGQNSIQTISNFLFNY
jgi:hypothetical protein